MQLEYIVFLFLASVIVSTWLLRKHKRIEQYALIFSLLRLKGFKRFIQRQERLSRFTKLVSEAGIVLGFGVFASDFLYGRKRRKMQRIAITVITLGAMYLLYSFSLSHAFGISPAMRPFNSLLSLIFPIFGFSGLLLVVLGITAFNIFSKMLAGIPSCPQVAPLIPGLQIPQLPIFIPVYAWLGILLALVVHETSHGIQTLGEKLKFKSAGIILLGFYPIGAFVEPDEEELKKARDSKKLRVYSAGPSSNLFSMIPLFFVAIVIAFLFVAPAAQEYQAAYTKGIDHVEIGSVSETLGFCGNPPAPAYGKLEAGMTLLEINGTKIGWSRDVFRAIAKRPFMESEFLVESSRGVERVFITPHQETNYFGFEAVDIMREGFDFPQKEYNNYFFAFTILDIFSWAFLISFLLGIFNFLPLVLLDGWHIAGILYPHYLKPFIKSKRKREGLVRNFFLFVIPLLILLNALPLFL